MSDDADTDSKDIRELSFVSAERRISLPATGTPGAKGATQRAAVYEDFTIDGVRLYSILFPDHDPDEVTSFDSTWPQGAIDCANELMGRSKPELDDGRVPLYVCPECADLGCGALTVEVELTDEFAVWRSYGWQSTLEDGWDVGDYTHLAALKPLRFARSQYDAVLNDAVEHYAAMPKPPPPPEPSLSARLFDRLLRRFGL